MKLRGHSFPLEGSRAHYYFASEGRRINVLYFRTVETLSVKCYNLVDEEDIGCKSPIRQMHFSVCRKLAN